MRTSAAPADHMRTAVDTSVLLDVILDDPKCADRSEAALRAAAVDLDMRLTASPRVLRPPEGRAREGALSTEAAANAIPVRLTFWSQAGGALRLAWHLDIELRDASHRWLVLVDAETGTVLEKHDLVVSGIGIES